MVNLNKLTYALLFAASVVCSCSQNDDFEANESKTAETKEIGIVFRLQTNASTATRSVEDSYVPEQGTEEEYKVNSARVYFYDSPTKLFVRSVLLTNLTKRSGGTSYDAVYEAERVSVPQGTYDIFVTANTSRQIDKENEADFLADIDSMSYVQGYISDISKGIIMTNRATANLNTVIVNNEKNEDNVVSIELERVLARIDIGRSAESYDLTDDKNRKYATVILDGHYVVNFPKYYYSYRHTSVLTSLAEPTWNYENLEENFGNVKDVNGYVIDPYFFKKTINATNFKNEDKYYAHYFGDYKDPNAIQWTSFKPASGGTVQYSTVYCAENCMLAPAQKNGYSTGVIFRARIEPNDNVYRLAADGSLQLITNKQSYPEVLYYYNYNFYASADALAAAVGTTVTESNMDLYQARKYEKTNDGYRCYYIYWVRHLDNYKPTVMGVMEFAIVRNNLYRLRVANISGVGDPSVSVIPDTPDEGETYLKVVLNVKPWIVRNQTNIEL